VALSTLIPIPQGLGNSSALAAKPYLQVTDAPFDRAVVRL